MLLFQSELLQLIFLQEIKVFLNDLLYGNPMTCSITLTQTLKTISYVFITIMMQYHICQCHIKLYISQSQFILEVFDLCGRWPIASWKAIHNEWTCSGYELLLSVTYRTTYSKSSNLGVKTSLRLKILYDANTQVLKFWQPTTLPMLVWITNSWAAILGKMHWKLFLYLLFWWLTLHPWACYLTSSS